MNVEKHISALLHEHDCVIVTDFGGFVANYKPAFIHPSSHTIAPPAKRLAFNSNLVHNDGLLAQHIANQMQISYAQACKLIKTFVDVSFHTLNNGQRLVLPQIGTLYLDADGHIRFDADNQTQFSLDSFGLFTLQTPVIHRSDVSAINYNVNEKRKWWQLFEVIPVAAVLTLLFLNGPSVDQMVNKNLMGFGAAKAITPPSSTVSDTEIITPVISQQKAVVHTVVLEAPKPQPEVKQVVDNVSNSAIATSYANTLHTPQAQAVTTNISESATQNYFVVAGCFKSDANANAYTAQLKAQGLNAQIIGKRNGLNVVTCFAGSKAETMVALQHIKQKLGADVWVLKN